MRKQKTPQEIQDQIERVLELIDNKMDPLNTEVCRLIRKKNKLRNLAADLDDPHALIPPGYDSVPEWIAAEGAMTTYIAMHIFRNKLKLQLHIPRDGSRKSWKIVRCKPASYYREAVSELLKTIKDETK